VTQAIKEDLAKLSFVNTLFLPALWVFLIPALTLAFFLHAQYRLDDTIRQEMLSQLASSDLNEQEEAEQRSMLENVPISRMMLVPEVAKSFPESVQNYYAWFRNMIRLSFWSIASGVLVVLIGGICVVASFRSQFIQCYSLSLGWHLLRIFSALQTVAQGFMVVALSYWVTALWFNFYAVKLIFIAGAIALLAVIAVVKGIFTAPKTKFAIEGEVLDETPALRVRQQACDLGAERRGLLECALGRERE